MARTVTEPSKAATPAAELLRTAESELLDLASESQRADWVYSTYVNEDTEVLASAATSRLIAATMRRARELSAFPADQLAPEDARKVRLLRVSLPLLAPSDPSESLELTRLVASMQASYAKGRHTPRGATEPADLQGLERILFESRDPALLEDVWSGWHVVGRTIRPSFVRYVDLANRGARELGFPDTGAMWASRYDLEPDEFAREVDRLWGQVRPFYESLHAFVRTKLSERYGPEIVGEGDALPCHLLGNMWAQSWEGIYPLVAAGLSDGGVDLTALLQARGTGPIDMVRYGEGFFDSLGFAKLPASFWQRSMFLRPRDREVVCHASAWDIDLVADLRIKMCLEVNAEDFHTVHHELGHNYYQRAYGHQSYLFRDSAHDGFHEAVGDAVDLSVTPEYLARIGLLADVPPADADLGLLLHRALEKVAFLPFGLLIDRWRWKVFSGEIPTEEYNRSWWEMRRTYQGVRPPTPRGEEEFDPGAKYHVPSNVPYVRYFLAHILQFQFHRALLRAAGYHGPLHRGSIYGSRAAGERLRAMLEMGASREWPDALEAGTGERRMDAGALLEYFAPLRKWLDEQNRGHSTGW